MRILQEQEQQAQIGLVHRLDPKIILANRMLQKRQLELMEAMEQEAINNPILGTEDSFHTKMQEVRGKMFGSSYVNLTVIENIQSSVTLNEHLYTQLQTKLHPELYKIGESIVNNLDQNGRLNTPLILLSAETGVPVNMIEHTLELIQEFDPPGIAARNLQECLQLQLKARRAETLPDDADIENIVIAEIMIRDYFLEFYRRRFDYLAEQLHRTRGQIEDAAEYIRRHLTPHPAALFKPTWNLNSEEEKAYIMPDVSIFKTEWGYDYKINGPEPEDFYIAAEWKPVYEQSCSRVLSNRTEQDIQIINWMKRARLIVGSLKMHRETISRIIRFVIDYQSGYVATGSKQFLRPVTRTHVARSLHIHESTVSRAVGHKFVQLPDQQVVPYSLFFATNTARTTQEKIQSLILSEDPSHPHSDREIVAHLQEMGFDIARRTVVKYREQLGILSSKQRRRTGHPPI